MLEIRDASIADAERLLEIYDYYVRNTAITFECETPTFDEFRGCMERIMDRYPYLVIVRDGKIEGYAYAGPFVGRTAYDWSSELTIYLDHTVQKQGLGRKLYSALEQKLEKMGILNLYACIGYPKEPDDYLNTNSLIFIRILDSRRLAIFIGAAISSEDGMT